jgi:hypothetical protein
MMKRPPTENINQGKAVNNRNEGFFAHLYLYSKHHIPDVSFHISHGDSSIFTCSGMELLGRRDLLYKLPASHLRKVLIPNRFDQS